MISSMYFTPKCSGIIPLNSMRFPPWLIQRKLPYSVGSAVYGLRRESFLGSFHGESVRDWTWDHLHATLVVSYTLSLQAGSAIQKLKWHLSPFPQKWTWDTTCSFAQLSFISMWLVQKNTPAGLCLMGQILVLPFSCLEWDCQSSTPTFLVIQPFLCFPPQGL